MSRVSVSIAPILARTVTGGCLRTLGVSKPSFLAWPPEGAGRHRPVYSEGG